MIIRFHVLVVALFVVGCDFASDSDDFDRSPSDIAGLISVTTVDGSDSLPADGFSKVEITATISPGATLRTVQFTTSKGTLLGGDIVDGVHSVDANESGVATIELQSDLSTGDAIVRGSVKEAPADVVDELRISFIEPDLESIVRFEVVPSSAPADGATLYTIAVAVNPNLPATSNVTFTTTLGLFSPEDNAMVTRPVDAENMARADLKSSSIGTARISADIAGFRREDSLQFVPAGPDFILARAVPIEIPATSSANTLVTAEFRRTLGDVTAGVRGAFSARHEDGTDIGVFRNETVIDANGRATANFFPGAVEYRGPVTITIGIDDSTVTGAVQVQIVDPPATRLMSYRRISAAIDDYLSGETDAQQFQGAVGVLIDGQVVVARGYGLADIASQKPNSTDTRFPVLALSQSFHQRVMRNLVDQGFLSSGAPLSNYGHILPGHPDLSVSQILDALNPDSNHPDKDRIANVVIELVSDIVGMTYESYVAQMVFAPIGMKATGVGPEGRGVATGYTLADDSFAEHHPPEEGFYTTVTDLVNWNQALSRFDNDTSKSRAFVRQRAQIPGYGVDFLRLSDHNVTVIVLTNLPTDAFPATAPEIARIVTGRPCECELGSDRK